MTKHSPLPWHTESTDIGVNNGIWRDDNTWIADAFRIEDARLIVLAVNYFEEMRELVESVTTIYGANDTKCVIDSATELLARLEADDE